MPGSLREGVEVKTGAAMAAVAAAATVARQWQTQQQKWRGQAKNQQNEAAALAMAETAVVAMAIVAAWQQQRRWLGRTTDGGFGCSIGGSFCMARGGCGQIKLWRECWDDGKKVVTWSLKFYV
jgi:hypothetical protein